VRGESPCLLGFPGVTLEKSRKVWLHFSFVYRDMSGQSHETTGQWSHNLAMGYWERHYEKTT
jgi:hypothetical protein